MGVKLLVHLFIIYYFLLNKGQVFEQLDQPNIVLIWTGWASSDTWSYSNNTCINLCSGRFVQSESPSVETQSLLKSWILAIFIRHKWPANQKSWYIQRCINCRDKGHVAYTDTPFNIYYRHFIYITFQQLFCYVVQSLKSVDS